MKKQDEILISIIVPIYNVENELPRCIESIINQTYKNIEIILVNDGSDDSCLDICKEYAEKDRRIGIINKMNGGLSDARNVGLKVSKGEYVMFVDSDDHIELDSCERFISIIAGRKIDIIVAEANEVNKNYIKYLKHSNLIEGREYSSIDYIKKAITATEWYAPVWLNMYRKDFLLDKDLYFKKGIYHEDMEILPRLFLNANNIVYLNYKFYNYVIREGSITQRKYKGKHKQDLQLIYNEWKNIFDKVQDDELKQLLYGILSKHYLNTCRKYKIREKNFIEGIDNNFILKNALNIKEKIKAIIYIIWVKGV